MVELAERLTGLAPVDPPTKAFFVGSGLGPPDATAERYPHSLDK